MPVLYEAVGALTLEIEMLSIQSAEMRLPNEITFHCVANLGKTGVAIPATVRAEEAVPSAQARIFVIIQSAKLPISRFAVPFLCGSD